MVHNAGRFVNLSWRRCSPSLNPEFTLYGLGTTPTSPSEALLSGQIDMDGLDYGNGRYSNPDNGQTYSSNY